ncbi:BatA domain-containing protein [Stieleria sp. TO1_6]|uniref:BatA domain-containing protein n=1 Tax=Stieleria tagensis TaxID=2956795 RepID=UPI00209B1F7D|nr:BatA domain-containing protein [Stieleria tagensis]MCO8120738.1 BatA domain-containing protein [Stieleria tagensis]
MSLLNAALAFGAFAFTIPLVIHLLFRSRFKTVDWGAMHLLDSMLRTNRRRMQVTHWLLLLLRCLIPVVLAFCMARPVWTWFRALAGDAPRTLVVALDDSRSMSATPSGRPSRIEVAKQQIGDVLADLSRRDEVILVRGSRLGAVPAKMGVADALSALRKVDASGGAVSIGQLLDAARQAAEDASHSRRQILLVSDFQSNAVDASTLELASQIETAAAAEPESDPAAGLVIDLLNVGNGSADLNNLSIDSVTVDSPVVVSRRSGVYSATIRNAFDLPANDLRLVWSIDGNPLEPRVISIEANSSVTNRLTHSIDHPGTHQITAAISRADNMLADNQRSVAVEVMQEVNVLLVDGKPANQPLAGQADFLAISLSPFAFGGDDRPDPVRAAVVSSRKFEQAFKEQDVRVIILADVGKLTDSVKRQISDFVDDGGSLVVFDGPDVRPDLYNEPWAGSHSNLRFPAKLGEVQGESRSAAGKNQNQYSIDQPASFYRPWQVLSRGDENPLSDVDVSAYRKLELNVHDTSSASNAVVLLRSGDGAPLAVSEKQGAGTVIQFAISGNDAWTNLPLRPVFLPLIQQMVLDLAGKQTDAMIDVGQPIVLSESDWPQPIQKFETATRTTYTLQTPRGETELDPPPDGDPIRITATYSPGVYRIQRRTVAVADPQHSESVVLMRVAGVDASESLLVDVGPERLNRLAQLLGAGVFENADSLKAVDHTRSNGREIWRWLLALLLVALVAELWLQQNLVRRRTMETAR